MYLIIFLMFTVLNIFFCNCLQNNKSLNIRTISFGNYRGPSPINLAGDSMIRKRILTSLQFSSEHSKSAKIEKKETDEGLEVTFRFEDSKPTVTGGVLKFTYEFDKLFFHWSNANTQNMGSYHTVEGKYFPMEVQAYYTVITPLLGELLPEILNNDGDVMDNPAIKSILEVSETSVDKLIPHVKEYAVYRGSFVTPPYTEDVKWIIFLKPQKISTTQFDMFQKRKIKSAREIQPLNGRKVFYIRPQVN